MSDMKSLMERSEPCCEVRAESRVGGCREGRTSVRAYWTIINSLSDPAAVEAIFATRAKKIEASCEGDRNDLADMSVALGIGVRDRRDWDNDCRAFDVNGSVFACTVESLTVRSFGRFGGRICS